MVAMYGRDVSLSLIFYFLSLRFALLAVLITALDVVLVWVSVLAALAVIDVISVVPGRWRRWLASTGLSDY